MSPEFSRKEGSSRRSRVSSDQKLIDAFDKIGFTTAPSLKFDKTGPAAGMSLSLWRDTSFGEHCIPGEIVMCAKGASRSVPLHLANLTPISRFRSLEQMPSLDAFVAKVGDVFELLNSDPRLQTLLHSELPLARVKWEIARLLNALLRESEERGCRPE